MSLLSERIVLGPTLICNVDAFGTKCFTFHCILPCCSFRTKCFLNSSVAAFRVKYFWFRTNQPTCCLQSEVRLVPHWSVMLLLSEWSTFGPTLICNVAAFRVKCFWSHTELKCCFQSEVLLVPHWSVMLLLSEWSVFGPTLYWNVAFRVKYFWSHTDL